MMLHTLHRRVLQELSLLKGKINKNYKISLLIEPHQTYHLTSLPPIWTMYLIFCVCFYGTPYNQTGLNHANTERLKTGSIIAMQKLLNEDSMIS